MSVWMGTSERIGGTAGQCNIRGDGNAEKRLWAPRTDSNGGETESSDDLSVTEPLRIVIEFLTAPGAQTCNDRQTLCLSSGSPDGALR